MWAWLALLPGVAALSPLEDRWVLCIAFLSGAASVSFCLAGQAVSPRRLLLLAALLRLMAAAGPQRFDNDVWRYLWDGAVVAHGASPYQFAPSQITEYDPQYDPLLLPPDKLHALQSLVSLADQQPRLREALGRINFPFLPTIYPPVSQLAFAAPALLAPGSDHAWRTLAAAADWLACLLLLRLLQALGRPTAWAALYALHPLPALEAAAGGHQDPLGVCLLLAAALLWTRGRPRLSGLALTAAAGVKLFPASLLIFWPQAAPGAALGALLLALPFLHWGTPDLAGLRAYGAGWEFFSGPYALLGGRAALHLTLLLLILLTRPWRPRPPERRLDLGLIWVEALIALSPVVNPWYVPWAMAAGCARGSLAWPVFGLLIPLAYLPHTDFGHPWPLRLIAWTPLACLLAREGHRAMTTGQAPTCPKAVER